MSAMLAPKTRDLIVKLLAKTDTPFEGESIAFLSKVNQIRRDQKLTWDDLIVVPAADHRWAPPPPPPRSRPPEWLDDWFLVRRNAKYCTAWEQNFVNSFHASSRLSSKQQDVLSGIADKLRERGLS